MIKRMKDYFAQKKEIRTLALDTLKKLNHTASVLSGLSDMAAAAAETFNTDDFSGLVENINKLANDPELTSAYYSQVSRQAHEERMAELNNRHC
ncbi:MAG: hypothetical protein J6C64_00640 [Lachnospiraceae bacterium]|nr:hypothetical protein [Lachnospiraceae bacterium]